MFSHLQQGFQPFQDMVPHLSSLTRLSQLQELSLPLHAPINKHDLESLAALKSLHTLHLEWRYKARDGRSQFQLMPAAFLPHASLSMLTPLTELSIRGRRYQHLHGEAALPRLKRLSFWHSVKLELTGRLGVTSLISLTLAELTVTKSYAGMLDILRSLPLLTQLVLRQVEAATDDEKLELKDLLQLPSLEHLSINRCMDFDYSLQADSDRVSRALTRLHLKITELVDDPEIPALSQLSWLVHLQLDYTIVDAVLTIPSSLTSLMCLKKFV